MSEHITKMQLGEGLDQDRTDLKRLAEMDDEDIDFSDIPELDEAFFANAELVMPRPKQAISLRLDADMLDWLKAKGQGYQTRINAILRAYYEAHKDSRG